MLFGAVFDHACLLWDKECGEGEGSCLYYDNDQIRLHAFLLVGGFRIVALAFLVMAYTLYKPPRKSDYHHPDLGDDDAEKDDIEQLEVIPMTKLSDDMNAENETINYIST